ncbi:MAG: hypothetical protein PHR94_05545 [Methylomonas lenta]|nr:hypothetical protein [Methylomonas lenta]
MKDKRHWLTFGATLLVNASLLSGCASSESKDSAHALDAKSPAMATQDQAPATQVQDRPGGLEGGMLVINATVKAIDKTNRVVTLQTADGKMNKIKCGPEVRNFAQIRVGDEVKTSLLETVELFVTGNEDPAAERVTEAGRAPLGGKPGFAAVDAIEVRAAVVGINYQTREVTLQGPEGNFINMIAGPEVRRLNEVKIGDSVVARMTRAISIEVSKPISN